VGFAAPVQPAEYDGLPGLPFPAPTGSHPAKDEVADYVRAYAEHFDLPVRLSSPVTGLHRDAGRSKCSA